MRADSVSLPSGMPDPRPHLGEPLALDLLNTRWVDNGPRDLLTDVTGLGIWLASAGLADRVTADEPTLAALLEARAAIYDVAVGGMRDARTHAALNSILDHGRIRRALRDCGPVAEPEVTAAAWLPGWLAAENLLELLDEAPDRIRQCAHTECVLFFYDTSKNGTRRWHSMSTCGNRAKAARHYAKKS